jgi:hypothetical protein
MPWNDSWNDYRLYPCAICAFRASACGHCAGRTPGTPERPTLNPRVRGSSPWRRTRLTWANALLEPTGWHAAEATGEHLGNIRA